MKKLLLSLMCLGAMTLASAGTVTWTPSAEGYGNAQEISSLDLEGKVTITFAKGTNNNTPKYYTSGSAFRFYGGNTMTVAGNGVSIVEVLIQTPSGNPANAESTVTAGSLDITPTLTTWTGEAESFTFTQGGSTGHMRIEKLTVTFAEAGEIVVAAPMINPGSGEVTAGTEVTLTCSTEGAKIYYTVDGTAPTAASTLYTAPIAVNEAMTLKAVAELDGTLSSVSEAVYTIKPEAVKVNDIAAFLAMADTDNNVEITGTVTVVYQNGNNLYVTDASGCLLIYGGIGKTYVNGDQLTGIAGKYKDQNDLPEMLPDATTFGAATAGTAVEPALIMLGDLNAEPLSSYIELQGITIKTISGKNVTLEDANGDEAAAYNSFSIDLPAAGSEGYTVRGFVSIYKGTYQVTLTEVFKPGEEPEVFVPTGDGTEANPYTVADVKGMKIETSDGNKYWVVGYILGSATSATKLNTPENASDTNIALGASADAEDFVPVALPQGDMRTALGVATNPGNVGKEVKVYGTLEKYFSTYGVKNVSDYAWVGEPSGIEAIEAVSGNAVYYNLQGARVLNPEAGIFIRIQDGKAVKVLVK